MSQSKTDQSNALLRLLNMAPDDETFFVQIDDQADGKLYFRRLKSYADLTELDSMVKRKADEIVKTLESEHCKARAVEGLGPSPHIVNAISAALKMAELAVDKETCSFTTLYKLSKAAGPVFQGLYLTFCERLAVDHAKVFQSQLDDAKKN